jgi:hypothetical protein
MTVRSARFGWTRVGANTLMQGWEALDLELTIGSIDQPFDAGLYMLHVAVT